MCDLIKPCDASAMLKTSNEDVDFVIDGIHFGRGKQYHDKKTNTKVKISTTNTKIWRIVNDTLSELSEKSKNIFYNKESYLIQWKTRRYNHRHRSDEHEPQEDQIYFHWKGERAPKDFSPLPEEIERDFPPVERIVQWAEPPAFLSLFEGRFVVNIGTHDNQDKNAYHLYILRGELENETHLYEVPLKFSSLRSRTSFVLCKPVTSTVIIWHGAKSNPHCREAAKSIAKKVFCVEIEETFENLKNEEFISALDGVKDDYFRASIKTNNADTISTSPRLFYFNSITGTFLATEVICAHKNASFPTPFPFIQTHLYTSSQPALFLLDDGNEIWFWHGWRPENETNVYFDLEYPAAEETAKNYAALRTDKKVKRVFAGLESLAFTNLFPTWEKREDVKDIQAQRPVVNSIQEEEHR